MENVRAFIPIGMGERRREADRKRDQDHVQRGIEKEGGEGERRR